MDEKMMKKIAAKIRKRKLKKKFIGKFSQH